MYIGKIFDKFEIDLPFEKKSNIILVGANGS